MPHSVRKLLLDVSISCEEISKFINGKNFIQFQNDRILQLAIERQFERIDQDNLKNRIPEYNKIIGFRNVIAHGYDIIDETVLWDFAENRVPELLKKVQVYS